MSKPVRICDTLFCWFWGDGLYGLVVTIGVENLSNRRQFLIGFDVRTNKAE